MRFLWITPALLAVLGMAWLISGGTRAATRPAASHAAPAGEAAAEAAVVDRLRAEGQAAVDRLREQRRQLLDRTAIDRVALQRLEARIDQVAGARYSSRSGLFWHTDWTRAQKEAQRTGKPILSLRMLGKLTDEYSCANSRFFRTTLYVSPSIARQLRERFVLHWRTFRPAPVMTIDFGDGRVLRRTITGNSAHYLLTADGRPLDVLPGMYAPRAFAAWLKRADELHRRFTSAASGQQEIVLRRYHHQRLEQIARDRANDLARLVARTRGPGGRPAFPALENAAQVGSQQQAAPTLSVRRPARKPTTRPTAAEGARIAAPKRAVEAPLIDAATRSRLVRRTIQPLAGPPAPRAQFRQLADLHPEFRELDRATLAVIRTENPAATESQPDRGSERVWQRMLERFRQEIAIDTLRNEYELHRRLHQRFANGQAEREVEPLNRWVYAALFEMPAEDPWLGLAPANVYSGLVNNGWVNSHSPGRRKPAP